MLAEERSSGWLSEGSGGGTDGTDGTSCVYLSVLGLIGSSGTSVCSEMMGLFTREGCARGVTNAAVSGSLPRGETIGTSLRWL